MLSGYPRQGKKRGRHVLQCMKAMAPLVNESLVELWDKVIPKLMDYITGAFIYPKFSHMLLI